MNFTVILTPDEDDGGYVAECPAIPGCVSEGDGVEDALAHIREAIGMCLDSLAARNQPLPQEGSIIVATVDADAPAPRAHVVAKRHLSLQGS
jgi:predicted RNase H-like HicB family nuclease